MFPSVVPHVCIWRNENGVFKAGILPSGVTPRAFPLWLWGRWGAAMEEHVQMIHTGHRVRARAITKPEAYWQFICKIGQAVLWAWASNEISGLISLFFCSIKYKIGLRIWKARVSLNLRVHVTCVLSNYSPWPVSLDAQWIWMPTTTIKKKMKVQIPQKDWAAVHWEWVEGGRKTMVRGLG